MNSESITGLSDFDFVAHYSQSAPLALALERSLESSLYSGRTLKKPILDLGCGDGIFAETTFGKGTFINHGVDPNPIEIERAKHRNIYKNLLNCTGDKIPLSDKSISTVISNSVLEHIADVDSVLGELNRVLENGGELHITVPTDKFEMYSTLSRLLRLVRLTALDTKYRNFYNNFWHHYHAYPESGWRSVLQRNGFETKEVVEYCSKNRAMSHDVLVLFALPAFFVNKIFKRYFVFPKLRTFMVSAFRVFLPKTEVRKCKPNTGGLIYLRSTKTSK